MVSLPAAADPLLSQKAQFSIFFYSAEERRLITKISTPDFKKTSLSRVERGGAGAMHKHTCQCVIVAGLCVSGLTLGAVQAASAQSGNASVHSGGRTASGEYAHSQGMTAAHRSLPFGTKVRVTNHRTGRSVVVRINDRGPFVRGRVIDVTPAAARELGFSGVTQVSLEVVKENAN